ncbi:MAG: FadR family transcriptional regulator [Lachnospiraceae bacterium]|nr:FadR family transcriptional regulator [Lachnospiraceae bacterium]
MSTKNMMATDKVIEYFKDNVRKGIWKTGDKLPSEPELSELIGVGRSSVREAMKILESSHTIQICRGDGTYISDPDEISFIEPLLLKVVLQETRMQELIDFRESIEMALMRLVISNADAENIRALDRCNQRLLEYVEEERTDAAELFQLDMEFHTELSKAARNTIMSDIYKLTFDIFGAVILKNYKNGKSAQSALDTHRALVDAIKRKDFLRMGYAVHASVELWGTWGTREKVSDYLKENHVDL